jgi:hypothetical protein
MNHPKYPVVASSDYLNYFFFSDGPKGRIAKGVIYSQIEGNLYNLSFGDWNGEVQGLDDSSRSDNKDRDLVLATVADTLVDFTKQFPEAQIFIEGSTSARTRLYQIGIVRNLLEIKSKFIVRGSINDDWEEFKLGRNYDAFLIKRK